MNLKSNSKLTAPASLPLVFFIFFTAKHMRDFRSDTPILDYHLLVAFVISAMTMDFFLYLRLLHLDLTCQYYMIEPLCNMGP